MKKYVAVDSGKFATKMAWVSLNKANELSKIQKCQFRTKMDAGNMEDDAIEKGTFVCEIGGKTFKIGNGATQSAILETSKKSEIHKNSTLLALALIASENEIDEMHVAIGSPVKEYWITEKRIDYKNYILPDGEVTVVYRTQSDEKVTKRFKIVSKYVYPESAGGIYLNMEKNRDGAGVIDIGSLNVNYTYFQNFEPDQEMSTTSEAGGQIIISNLSTALSAEFSRCDETLVSRVLKSDPGKRYLQPIKPNKEIETRSEKYITDFLLKHVTEIRRICDTKKWPLDYMQLTFVGGTSQLLSREIKNIFGETVEIPKQPEYANVIGFLRRLVGWELKQQLDYDIKEDVKTDEKKYPAA